MSRSNDVLAPLTKLSLLADVDDKSMLFLDIRQTLRSSSAPVNRTQIWGETPRRIILHLRSFTPALRISEPRERRASKIARLDDDESVSSRTEAAPRTAEERHKAGMANLYARGVTDEMIQRWYIGWNGSTLVYPRYLSSGQLQQIDLGQRISLLPNDRDGAIFMSQVLAKQAEKSAAKVSDVLAREKQRQTNGGVAAPPVVADGDKADLMSRAIEGKGADIRDWQRQAQNLSPVSKGLSRQMPLKDASFVEEALSRSRSEDAPARPAVTPSKPPAASTSTPRANGTASAAPLQSGRSESEEH